MQGSKKNINDLGNLSDCESLPFPDELEEWWSKLPVEVFFISNLIDKNGGSCWVVGGSIRDALSLTKNSNEFDLATNLVPDNIIKIFDGIYDDNNSIVTLIPTGLRYGTVTLKFRTGLEIEVTTLRTDSTYSDGRRPDQVKFGNSLKDDLLRRDFTVNAMAIDISRKLFYDPFNGLEDINAKVIRAVGNPHTRLSEDGLRILRAYRFAGNFREIWCIDSSLRNALEISINMLENVAKERIWYEFKKILNSKYAGEILLLMSEDKVLDMILHGKYLPKSRGILSQFNSTIIDYANRDVSIARLSLLLIDSLNGKIKNEFSLIKLSNKEVNQFNRISSSLGLLPNPKLKSELRLWRYFHDSYEELMISIEESLAKISGIEDFNIVSNIRDELLNLPPLSAGNEPLANGNWIMQRTGMQKGPRLGRLKSWLHTIQIERDLSNLGEVESVLCTLPWNQERYDLWPLPIWPKN